MKQFKTMLVAFAVALLGFGLTGCEKKGEETPATEESPSGEVKQAEVVEREIPAEYKEQAQNEITSDNAEQKAEELEKEIEADLAAQ